MEKILMLLVLLYLVVNAIFAVDADAIGRDHVFSNKHYTCLCHSRDIWGYCIKWKCTENIKNN